MLEAAQKNYSAAQYEVAQLYADEDNPNQDLKQSFDWMLKAAKADYSLAYLPLGKYYEQGIGITQNLDQALYWYNQILTRDAVTSSDEPLSEFVTSFLNALLKNQQEAAKLGLSRIYFERAEHEKDQHKAIELYQKAAELSHPQAKQILAEKYDIKSVITPKAPS